MKRILVTGGFGFIGSHLVEKLLSQGHSVHVVDNLSTSPISIINLMRELSYPRELVFYPYPIAEYRPSADAKFDEIYHLASPVGPAGILPFAGLMVRRVVEDTYTVMELAQRVGAKLVDVSTSEVYGGGQDGLCGETMPRVIQAETTARLEYAVAKLAAETALINMTRMSTLQAVIVRPFNVAGPRQSCKGGFVLPRFVAQAMRNEPITVFGDGTQVRAFTHVRDIVDGLLLAMDKGKSGEVYNLGNAANKTIILDLAARVKTMIGSGAITFTDGKTIYGEHYAEAADKYPDATKTQRDLGWKPTLGIDETIQDVWRYMQRTGRLEWLAGPEKAKVEA